jgi:ribosome-binding factor A
MTRRQSSVEELIQQETAKLVQRFLPISLVATVTDARVSQDLRRAQVWVAVYEKSNQDRVMNLLEKYKYDIQERLNKTVSLKYVPKIDFKLDSTGEKADLIDKLLGQIKKDR